MPQINFVRHRLKKLMKFEKKDQQFFQIAAIIGLASFMVFVGVLVVRLFLVSHLNTIETTSKGLLTKIKSQEEREKIFVVFVNKLGVLKEVVKNRKDKQQAIEYFSNIFGADVTVEKIVFDDQSQLLSFGLRAKDIFTLEKVIDILNNDQTKASFASLKKSGLGRSSEGSYHMQVTLVFNQNAKEK